MNLRNRIPTVNDWPTPGVKFLDITGVLHDPAAFAWCCSTMTRHARAHGASSIVAIESRGFVFGSVIAHRLDIPLVLARKRGKLPGAVYEIDYQTEYSTDAMAIQQHAPVGLTPFVIDDVLATGGTLLAAAALLKDHFNVVSVTAGVIVNLDFLSGRKKLEEQNISLIALENYE